MEDTAATASNHRAVSPMTGLVRTRGLGADAHRGDEGHRKLPDVLGVAWTLVAALAVLSPALRPGVALGSFDLLSRVGLTQRSGVAVHSVFPADQVLYFLPMINLAWHQVHSGQVPLWNPYNLLGLPLAFNWQSGVFSLPTLISYLVPLHYVYTVIVLVKLVVAGTGVYTLCRVLGQRPLSCAFAATTFELSGPMLHWYGWAMTGVTIWAAWILVAAILLIRGAHRLRDTIFLAVSIALSVYGGHPESLIVMTLALVIFFVVYLLMRAHTAGGSLRRPVFDLVVAGVCGLALSSPLLLPGLQTAAMSGRGAALGASAYPLADIPDVFAALQGNDFRVPPPYIGALTIVLAGVAVRLYWRRPVVTALAAVAVTAGLLSFQSPLYGVLQAAPGIRTITWNRAVMLLALATSILAGFGLDALVRHRHTKLFRRWAVGGFVVAGAVLVIAVGSVALGIHHVDGGQIAHFVWPAVTVVVGLAVIAALGGHGPLPGLRSMQRFVVRHVAGVLLVVQSGFLVATGVSFWSLSAGYFTVTPAVATLQRTVGDAVVAIGSCRLMPFSFPYSVEQGIRPDANIAYGVHEFAAYEPPLTKTYYQSWTALSGQSISNKDRRVGVFCPQIVNAREARIYGVRYILAPRRGPAPAGTTLDRVIGGERLFRVPDVAEATEVPRPSPATRLPLDAPGTPLAVTHVAAGSWRVATDARGPALLRLRLTAVPGWHATLDGRPLATQSWSRGAMLEADIPAGRHVVELHYWPTLFTIGMVTSGTTATVFMVAVIVVGVRRHRRAARQVSSP